MVNHDEINMSNVSMVNAQVNIGDTDIIREVRHK
jgi:hypothetical protein